MFLSNNSIEQSSILGRRQQNAHFLQQLELPALPPLDQLESSSNSNNNIKTSVLGNTHLITSTTQPLIQSTNGSFILPEPTNLPFHIASDSSANTTTTTSTTSPILSHTSLLNNTDPNDIVAATASLFPTPTPTSLASTHHSTSAATTTSLPLENSALFLNPTSTSFMLDMATAPTMTTTASLPQLSQSDIAYNHFRRSSTESDSDKAYSFVAIPGTNQRKRPRRRYDEIERLYYCNWPGCTKSYGTLNHLNAHVSMQQHGNKRHPNEFKEMRKEWRRQKKERDAARKANELTYRNESNNNTVADVNIATATPAPLLQHHHFLPTANFGGNNFHQMPNPMASLGNFY